MSSPSVSRTRELAPVWENTSRSTDEVQPQGVAQAQALGQPRGVDVHHHVDQGLDLRRLARLADVAQGAAHVLAAPAAPARRPPGCRPPSGRACPGGPGGCCWPCRPRGSAPRPARLRFCTSTWTPGLTVAQLMNRRPWAPLSSPAALRGSKIWRMAPSSVTTVMTSPGRAVTSAGVPRRWRPAPPPAPGPAPALTSCTATTRYPTSFRRRAMLAPIRPTPTTPMVVDRPSGRPCSSSAPAHWPCGPSDAHRANLRPCTSQPHAAQVQAVGRTHPAGRRASAPGWSARPAAGYGRREQVVAQDAVEDVVGVDRAARRGDTGPARASCSSGASTAPSRARSAGACARHW